jgi:hypothetical protein
MSRRGSNRLGQSMPRAARQRCGGTGTCPAYPKHPAGRPARLRAPTCADARRPPPLSPPSHCRYTRWDTRCPVVGRTPSPDAQALGLRKAPVRPACSSPPLAFLPQTHRQQPDLLRWFDESAGRLNRDGPTGRAPPDERRRPDQQMAVTSAATQCRTGPPRLLVEAGRSCLCCQPSGGTSRHTGRWLSSQVSTSARRHSLNVPSRETAARRDVGAWPHAACAAQRASIADAGARSTDIRATFC